MKLYIIVIDNQQHCGGAIYCDKKEAEENAQGLGSMLGVATWVKEVEFAESPITREVGKIVQKAVNKKNKKAKRMPDLVST